MDIRDFSVFLTTVCIYIYNYLKTFFLISKIYLLKSNQIAKQEPHKQHLQ